MKEDELKLRTGSKKKRRGAQHSCKHYALPVVTTTQLHTEPRWMTTTVKVILLPAGCSAKLFAVTISPKILVVRICICPSQCQLQALALIYYHLSV